jgi:hypothetical protein
MPNLRLGAVNLDPKDLAYVRALVRLFAHTEKLSWSFADAAPYDAVVSDPRVKAGGTGFLATFKGVVLSLGHTPGVSAADTVAYPIRADQFRDWLKLRQDSLLDVLYRADDPARAALPAAAPADVAVQHPGASRRFKLRRWPSADVLRGDPAAMRMATFMSRNALSIAQLAALTGQPEDACSRFIGVLQGAKLLIELVAAGEQGGSVVLPLAATATAAAAAAPAAAPARRGLMASLRRHLGL